MARLAQPGHRPCPAECLFDPLPDAQADRIAGVAGGSAIDRRAPPVGVLRHVRGHVDFAEFGDEVHCVETLGGTVTVRRTLVSTTSRTPSDAGPWTEEAPRRITGPAATNPRIRA